MFLTAVEQRACQDLGVCPASASAAQISRRDRLPPLGSSPSQLPGQLDGVGVSPRQLTCDPQPSSPVRRFRSRAPRQFCNQHRLLELGDGSKHLPDEAGSRCIIEKRCRAIGGYEFDAWCSQHREAHLLDHQVAGKSVSSLNNDGFGPVGLQAPPASPQSPALCR